VPVQTAGNRLKWGPTVTWPLRRLSGGPPWVDTSRVPRHFRIGLLAVAALASLAVAGLRIAHAARSSPPAPQYPVYGSSPSAEAAIFKSLHVPPGFRPFHPCVLGECFILRRSLPLDVGTARHVVEDLGVKAASTFVGHPPVDCGVLAARRVCQAEGIVRGEYVTVSVDQPEVSNPKRRTPRNRRTYQRFVVIPGTEVEVSVTGHCLHPQQCKEERQQEAAEARSDK
jgi:hypothetical protein